MNTSEVYHKFTHIPSYRVDSLQPGYFIIHVICDNIIHDKKMTSVSMPKDNLIPQDKSITHAKR